MTAFSSLRTWWDGRTPRERGLLTIMLALALAVLVWLAVVRPALTWREAAADRRMAAEAELAAVRQAVRATPPAQPASAVAAGGMEPGVRAAAELAGLTVDLAMDAEGRMGFRASNVATGRTLTWLAGMERAGVARVCALSVVENADATVNVEGSLTATAC